MSDSSYGGPPADPAGWMPPTNQSARGASRVPVIAALVVSLAALALAAAVLTGAYAAWLAWGARARSRP